MQSVRQFGNAVILAILSAGLVLGGLSLSLVEFTPPSAPASTDSLLPSPVPLTATATFPPPLESPTPTNTAVPTNTPIPPPSCHIPENWSPTTVQPGDTLETIAARYRLPSDELRLGNCLLTSNLVPGSTIYVPTVPTNTPILCAPGAVGWIKSYVVQPGDTFYHIATNHYTTASLMKKVNCHPSDFISPGDLLWVPNNATRTPTVTLQPFVNTPTLSPTEPLTETALPYTLTPEPTDTVPVPTSTPMPSETPVPTITASLTAFP
jgi:LysM repeat protein